MDAVSYVGEVIDENVHQPLVSLTTQAVEYLMPTLSDDTDFSYRGYSNDPNVNQAYAEVGQEFMVVYEETKPLIAEATAFAIEFAVFEMIGEAMTSNAKVSKYTRSSGYSKKI